MAIAGYLFNIQVSPDGSSWSDLGGLINPNFPMSKEALDASEAGDAFMKRIVGRYDSQLNLECHYEAADTGKALLRTCYDTNADVHVRIRNNTTALFSGIYKVFDQSVDAPLGDTVKQNFALQSNSGLTVI